MCAVSSGAEYRAKASELAAQVTPDTKHDQRLEIEKLVLFYLRLADQADLNGKTDVTYVAPTKLPD